MTDFLGWLRRGDIRRSSRLESADRVESALLEMRKALIHLHHVPCTKAARKVIQRAILALRDLPHDSPESLTP